MSKASDILDNVSKVIVGKRNVSELVLTSIIAGGHVLLEDVPGTGKTMMAKAFARITLANTGPLLNTNSPSFWLNTCTPVISEGSRSGVN